MAAKKHPTLTLNSKGAAVKRLQRLLGLKETGDFDQATEETVSRYQHAAGLPITGAADDATWGALHR